MPTRIVDGYEVAFTGEALAGTALWGAYVVIYGPSTNPMHMNTVYAKRRVLADVQFQDQHAAEAEAERAAAAILDGLRSR